MLQGAAVALARATASRYSPLAVVRRQEIVAVVAPIAGEASDELDSGQLIATLREYVACDLNGKQAAENLHIHASRLPTGSRRPARLDERVFAGEAH